ncbi:MAG: hypothetical protein HC809_17255 [Gammaproteobacteria bacterium]|nr:hypothetical protein [Gammaproteobacteria bacterium]
MVGRGGVDVLNGSPGLTPVAAPRGKVCAHEFDFGMKAFPPQPALTQSDITEQGFRAIPLLSAEELPRQMERQAHAIDRLQLGCIYAGECFFRQPEHSFRECKTALGQLVANRIIANLIALLCNERIEQRLVGVFLIVRIQHRAVVQIRQRRYRCGGHHTAYEPIAEQ